MMRIIQFSTPSCGQCPQQKEILQDVAAGRPDVAFETVDATEDVETANKYGVRSVPATIVLDADGTVVSKFDGLTQADKITNAL